MERSLHDRKDQYRTMSITAAAAGALLVSIMAWIVADHPQGSTHAGNRGNVHTNVTTTVFWVGEKADASNAFIHNYSSAWTEKWTQAYGGVDDPSDRCGWEPCKFKPKENAFYFALPYNDLDERCNHKPSQKSVPWFISTPRKGGSIIKNQWIRVSFGDRVVYAQWEDAGPAGEDDAKYVFGESPPKSHSGLDLSPAAADYLGLDGEGKTNWQFIAADEVPAGPWLQTTTHSEPDCAL